MSTKHAFPAPAFAYPVRKRLTKKGSNPIGEDLGVKELRGCAADVMDKTTSTSAHLQDHQKYGNSMNGMVGRVFHGLQSCTAVSRTVVERSSGLFSESAKLVVTSRTAQL